MIRTKTALESLQKPEEARLGRITRRRQILKLRLGAAPTRIEDRLAVEEPLEIRIGGTPLTLTMRTPGHDVELAAGFLLGEGVLTDPEDLRSAMHCVGSAPVGLADEADISPGSGENVLSLKLSEPATAAAAAARRSFTTTSACGLCGKDSIAAIQTRLTPVPPDQTPISASLLAAAPGLLRQQQKVFEQTGGTHAAGLFTAAGELVVVREDVGRHNTVDKVLGWAFLNRRLPLTGHVLQVSGRASFELVQKAAMARLPVLAAVSAPSSLAVELAQQVGMTLIGFSRGESMNIYTHPVRISAEPV